MLVRKICTFQIKFDTFAGTGTGKVGKKLLLLGHCNSGKTKFLYRLRAGSYPETVTSIEPLETSFDLSGKTIPVVDFPGHARARGKYWL